METGQMMAVLQQMPVSMASPQTGESVVPEVKIGGAFAGLLQGMSNKKTVQAVIAEQEVPLKVDGMANDVMSAFLATVGNGEKLVLPDQAESADVKVDVSSLQDNAKPESQNVMPGAHGEQFAPLFVQLPGRMPEAASITGSQTECLREIHQVDQHVTVQPDGALPEQIRRDAPVQQAAIMEIPAGLDRSLRSNGDSAIPVRALPGTRPIVPEKEPVVNVVSGNSVPTAPQHGPVVIEGDKQVVINPSDVPRVDVITSVPAEKAKVSLVQDRDSLQIASVMQQLQDRSPNVAGEAIAVAKAPLQQTAAAVQGVTETGNKASQPEQPVVVSRVTAGSNASAVTTSMQVSAQDNELIETAAPLVGTTGQQEQLQKIRSASTIGLLPAAAIDSAVGKPEAVPVQIDQNKAGKTLQSEQVDTGRNVVPALSGEKQAGTDEETPDRGMTGNFQSQVLHQQVKTERLLAVGTASGADTPPSALPAEQVVHQVRDRLVNHDTKPGSEQIVLRLSPEHFGELKVNLNLEGQRLKVEIVAENRMVRDSLMQHTDALKESLSRQNIKMESFEVTTGGNGASDGSRGQGNWRELAQQRQHNAWKPDGGYRLAAQPAPALAAYQMKSEHTMVDLHF